MPHLYFSRPSFAEQRLVFMAVEKSRTDEIESLMNADISRKSLISPADYNERADEITRQATLDIRTIKTRTLPQILRGVTGTVFNVQNAEQALINDSIDRATNYRTSLAQNALDQADVDALKDINNCARKTKNSLSYLQEKAAVCNDIKTALQQEITTVKERLRIASRSKHRDVAMLTRSVEQLVKRKKVVEDIDKDIQNTVKGSAEGKVLQEAKETDEYLRKVIANYAPTHAFDLNTTLLDWVKSDGKDTKLTRVLDDVADAMYPDDRTQQKKQFKIMNRIAQKLISKNGRFGTIGLIGAGALTLGIEPAIYKLQRGAWTPKGEIKNMISDYFAQLPVQELKKISEIQSAKTVADRLAKMSDLQPGTAFTIKLGGNDLKLKMVNCRGDLVNAIDADGTKYAFDRKGYNTVHYLSIKIGNKFDHKTLTADTTNLFTAA